MNFTEFTRLNTDINKKAFQSNADRSLANVWLGVGNVTRATDPCMVKVRARGSWARGGGVVLM